MKKYLSTFVSGFGAGVLSTVPLMKNFSCCLIIPVASYFSLRLYQRAENNYERIEASTALKYGILTGIFAAFFSTSFDLLITYIFHTNDFVYGIPAVEKMFIEYSKIPEFRQAISMLNQMSNNIREFGFSSGYALFILLNNLLVYPLFGIAGGLLGMHFINRRQENFKL
ncbi:MAG TPA: hypothetical protein VHP30_01255 [Ignavibacteriales bacterium]|nr:hypothetical protein [Ignavibacteriales bacterium]